MITVGKLHEEVIDMLHTGAALSNFPACKIGDIAEDLSGIGSRDRNKAGLSM